MIGPAGLWWRLIREAGWRHTLLQVVLALLGSALDAGGLGLAVVVLLGSGKGSLPASLPSLDLPLDRAVALLIGVMTVRAFLQALTAIAREHLRSTFTDRLRRDLLARVLFAPSASLDRVGRGDLLGLLMSDIGRSVLALDQGLNGLQSAASLGIYTAGVVAVGRAQTMPLLLGLGATALAALLQRSGAWQLGSLQTRLNGAIQRTVGDGLHGLKAIRAGAAEGWLLERFTQETRQYRRVLRQNVRRQSLFAALRDSLVVLVVGLWLLRGRGELGAAAVTTTLLLAYRAAGSLGAVISSRRLCVGALPGYGSLCDLRERLGGAEEERLAEAVPLEGMAAGLQAAHWQEISGTGVPLTDPLELRRGELVVVAGPSGTGKTTLLDGVAGLLAEEQAEWQLRTADRSLLLQGRGGAAAWRSLVAYAPQEAVLFEGSLRENLLLGRASPGASTDEHLSSWLRRLGLSHLLERPLGLDGRLSLALDCFSGGEIHRLGLLRAWLMERPVEVLDEPTAFLDAACAAQVRRILLQRSRSRLVLVASHDPELIAAAGRVIHRTPRDRNRAEALHGPLPG